MECPVCGGECMSLVMECPVCGGECMSLGRLGVREHYRCRACGMDSSVDGRPVCDSCRTPAAAVMVWEGGPIVTIGDRRHRDPQVCATCAAAHGLSFDPGNDDDDEEET